MKEHDYILLLQKQLDGPLTAGELAILEEWLRQSPDHQRLAEDVRRIWAATAGYTPSFAPNLDTDFEKVRARIRATEAAPTARRVSLYVYLARIAAVLLLAMGAVWMFREFGASNATERVEMADNQSKKLIELPDGSKVWLRQGGRLAFSDPFTGSERRVELDGEAYFEVSHDPSRPFRVQTSLGEIVEVLGTQFSVRTNPEAPTAVLVRSGKVRFSPDGRQEGAYLTAGKKAVHDKQTARITVSDALSFNELAWQAGGLEFIHTPLSQVVKDLESWYGVHIILSNSALDDCPYTAPMTNQPIRKVLDGLALIYQLQVKETAPGQYVLSGGICR